MKNKLILMLCVFVISCNNEEVGLADSISGNDIGNENGDNNNNNSDDDLSDWSSDTHSNNINPNYEEVFDDENSVRRIDIVFGAEEWDLMLEDMTGLYGDFGQGISSNAFIRRQVSEYWIAL